MYLNYIDGQFSNTVQDKTIRVYKNGDSSVHFDLKLRQNYKVDDVLKEICSNIGFGSRKNLRFFNVEGVEMTADELNYIGDGETLHVSQGDDFDQFSSFAEYQIIKLLGEGGFGKVMLAVHKQTKDKVAIKIMNVSKLGNAIDVDMIFSEVETMKSLNHNNIVRILQCFNLKNSRMAYVMEYLEGGELLELVQQRGRLSEEEAREYFTQICEAMYYCHREKLIHRDLKLENILLSSKSSRVIKIVDFGIAGLNTNINIDNEAGSLRYMPPEVLSGKIKSVGPPIDVWAMGCILFSMVCGELPFHASSNKETIEKICAGEFAFPSSVEKTLSREVKDLIEKILVVDPNERYTIPEIQKHPWMLGQKLKVEELAAQVEIDEERKDKKTLLKDIKASKTWKSENPKVLQKTMPVTSTFKKKTSFPSDDQKIAVSIPKRLGLNGDIGATNTPSPTRKKDDKPEVRYKRSSLQGGSMPKK